MKPFLIKSILFWFILLFLAFVNAIIREATYKPLLAPYIGIWAHQISSLTGILLFFCAIYFFLKKIREPYNRNDLIVVGTLWVGMTVIFETFMNIYVRHLRFQEVLETYYFWKGDTWLFVLLSLVVSPLIIHHLLKKRKNK